MVLFLEQINYDIDLSYGADRAVLTVLTRKIDFGYNERCTWSRSQLSPSTARNQYTVELILNETKLQVLLFQQNLMAIVRPRSTSIRTMMPVTSVKSVVKSPESRN
jgi:hypothetical protein